MTSPTGTAPRIVVLISGNGSNLQALIDAQKQQVLNGEIVAVISNRPDVQGLERAAKAGVNSKVVNHREFPDRESFDNTLQSVIDSYQPDLLVLAGFMRILTPAFVRHYQGRMINVHPSLLPKYQGLNTHQRAIDAGDRTHGVTVHFVTEELDGGPNIIQAEVPVFEGDTMETLAARVQVQEHLIYPEAVRWFCENRLMMKDNRAYLDNALLPEAGISVANTEA